jgi:uncharacterized protein YigE (DUF2233 family)
MKKLKIFVTFIIFCTASGIFAQQVFEFPKNIEIVLTRKLQFSGKDILLVNGPLVGKDGLPVGGYIMGNRLKKKWVSPSTGGGNYEMENGIFGLGTDGKIHIVRYNDLATLPDMEWAIQNGPILVESGINQVASGTANKFARSGMGSKPDGTIIIIIQLEPLYMRDFAELFIANDCTNAIYLDGGPYCGYMTGNGQFGSLSDYAVKIVFRDY